MLLLLLAALAAVAGGLAQPRLATPERFIPYSTTDTFEGGLRAKDVLVVDCTHPTAQQLTHHLKAPSTQRKLVPSHLLGDSSTDAVFNALNAGHRILNKKAVTCDHFDVDSFVSVWAVLNPDKALEHEAVLREVARIGDFRELRLDHPWQHDALALCCWLNSEEKRLFYRPFAAPISRGEGEGEDKFEHFLQHFQDVLEDTHKDEYRKRYISEYTTVVSGYELSNDASAFSHHPALGLVVVRVPEPLHYYSLFGVEGGRWRDAVLALYSGNRYELELKYTGYVEIRSRATYPRVEMQRLAQVLNDRETELNGGVERDVRWGASRITDSGPLLRLDVEGRKLSKEERYGHPLERPIHASLLPPAEMEATVVSYFSHALKDVEPKVGWSWKELHEFNARQEWPSWEPLRGA